MTSNCRPLGGDNLFGLEPAPVFFPNADEFSDPLAYIESIASHARLYGICKIVPPPGWKSTFTLDVDEFKFHTRLQTLNSLEAQARAKLTLYEQLFLFHRQRRVKMQIPSVTGRSVDLWRLKGIVNAMGGVEKVLRSAAWPTVAATLFSVAVSAVSAETVEAVERAYIDVLAPYVDFVNRAFKEGPCALCGDGSVEDPKGGETATCTTCDRGFHIGCLGYAKLPRDFLCPRCILKSGADFGFDDGEDHTLASFQKRADMFEQYWTERHPIGGDKAAGKTSTACADGVTLSEAVTLHGVTSLSKSQPGEAEGPKCVMRNGTQASNYVHVTENGNATEYVNATVVNKHLTTPAYPHHTLTSAERHTEAQFWSLVESSSETVEVEYGADISSITHGSGMPHIEDFPDDPYAHDGWNLNNLPVLDRSLLRFIKSDVSGMTIPWIYVGMLFSTFAWHKEDHYTYSINYQHFGATKTWYGVPSTDDSLVEALIQETAPELFAQQPDVLFQLVTLISPARLTRAGARVCTAHQQPNEFIITFPQAYHAGFNHGYNFNEAVNFALPDWAPHGLNCVNRYRDIHKFPVFSHEELMTTAYLSDQSLYESQWFFPHFEKLVNKELMSRAVLGETVGSITLGNFYEPSDCPEEEYQCTTCHQFAYWSQIQVRDAGGNCMAAYCLEHAADAGVACADGFPEGSTDPKHIQSEASKPNDSRFEKSLESPSPPLLPNAKKPVYSVVHRLRYTNAELEGMLVHLEKCYLQHHTASVRSVKMSPSPVDAVPLKRIKLSLG